MTKPLGYVVLRRLKPAATDSSYGMDDKEKLQEEEKKIRQLRAAADLTRSIIFQGDITYGEALNLVENFKSFALKLFPGKDKTFELIYRPRFNRVLEEKYRL